MMFFKKSKRDNEIANVLQETASLLGQINNNIKPKEVEKPHTEEEKRRAAYALNLCMVSISQIIDYNDVNILEQEYDGILNNLNLEKMPKDEALLNILKQILDTITFFRIQEGDRKFIEMEYQQRMKQAIWSAVPNFGMIISTNNPATMALSLATQVGIGYMNYRKEKADAGLEKMKAEWQLQRSAMEQFNGLRRELFDTAWRLADEYDFPDKFRLTERQIRQYNDILMDENILRRYERLASIQNNFEAYPPFWYFFGHTAALIYHELWGDSECELADKYKGKAVSHFNKYFGSIRGNNLLREDEIQASCALEYIDLSNTEINNQEIGENVRQAIFSETIEKIRTAEKCSGVKNDVLQLCALAYMKAGNKDEAIRLLRMLVGEGYNAEVNGQLLSAMYIEEYVNNNNKDAKNKYTTLCRLIDPCYLYPFPSETEKLSTDGEKEKWIDKFIRIQRRMLIEKIAFSFDAHYKKCEHAFDRLNSLDERFELLTQIFAELENAPCVSAEDMRTYYDNTSIKISENEGKLEQAEKYAGKGTKKERLFWEIVHGAYKGLVESAIARAKEIKTMEELSLVESKLVVFCNNAGLSIHADEMQSHNYTLEYGHYDVKMLKNPDTIVKAQKFKDMLKIINEKNCSEFVSDKDKYSIYKHGEAGFERYCKKKGIDRTYRLAVFDRHSLFHDYDLIFSIDGIKVRSWNSWSRPTIPYSAATLPDNHLQLGKNKYKIEGLDKSKLSDLIEELKKESDESSKPDTGASLFYNIIDQNTDDAEAYDFYIEQDSALMLPDTVI